MGWILGIGALILVGTVSAYNDKKKKERRKAFCKEKIQPYIEKYHKGEISQIEFMTATIKIAGQAAKLDGSHTPKESAPVTTPDQGMIYGANDWLFEATGKSPEDYPDDMNSEDMDRFMMDKP